MKLQSVEYSINDNWYTSEYVPNNPRSVLIYTPEDGTAEGSYRNGEWIQYRWSSKVNPLCWREMPRYNESNNSLQQ